MNDKYKQKVELLIRLIPLVAENNVFAIHGGTAINLFVRNMPRGSIDIDLTYIPLENREESLLHINENLESISHKAKSVFPGIHIIYKSDTCKLLCEYQRNQIKIEVNLTKRGIVGGNVVRTPLCKKAQEEFRLYCEADIVPLTLLYGGKMAAALSRQHPRDLFDIRYMEYPLEKTREGFLFCILGSDRPLYESFSPTLLDQRATLMNQFEGMTEIEFTYQDFEETRAKLIADVNNLLTDDDKAFLVSFENADPDWNHFVFGYFKDYPSIRWKLQNLLKLKKSNPKKLIAEAEKLQEHFFCHQ